jgi:hypothetical protein
MRLSRSGVVDDLQVEDISMSLVKLIVITIAVILSILFFGRFLF